MVVEFHNNSLAVKAALDTKAEQFLEEAASEIESAAHRNSRVASGQLKGSWAHIVDGKTATISIQEQYILKQERREEYERKRRNEQAFEGEAEAMTRRVDARVASLSPEEKWAMLERAGITVTT